MCLLHSYVLPGLLMQQLSCVCTATGVPRQPEGSGGARQGSAEQRTPVDQQGLQQAAPEGGMDLQAIDGEADSHRQYKGNRRRSLMSLGLSFQMAISFVLTQSMKWSNQQLSLGPAGGGSDWLGTEANPNLAPPHCSCHVPHARAHPCAP